MKSAIFCFAKLGHFRGALASPLAALLAAGPGLLMFAGPASAEPAGDFLSRVTVEIPVVTQHIPEGHGLNQHNWGAVVDIALDDRWSVVGGEFKNSYYRDTALVGARYGFWQWHVAGLKIDFGAVVAADLNGGYKGYSSVDPLLGALSIKITRDWGEPDGGFLRRSGVAITVVPNRNTAINLALAVGL